jgi:predicted nucleotidyltransferase
MGSHRRARKRGGHVELGSALDRNVVYAARMLDIARVIVFGSFARERTSAFRDLDVVIVRDAGPPDLVPGDVIGIRTADFPTRLEATPFGRTILREGRSCFARPPWRSRSTMARRNRDRDRGRSTRFPLTDSNT